MIAPTDIKNAVAMTEQEAQYDSAAKRLLGNKMILSHILVRTVDAFRGMKPKDVAACIEGEPLISSVPVEPGLTNARQRLTGLNTESSEPREGLVRFDIIFYVRTKDGLSQIIVNVEAQKGAALGYDILNRAIFYVCRMVSSQKERDFTHTNYDDIKQVYSIWICMNQAENSMNHIHLTNDCLLGSYRWPGKIDLLNIVLLGLSEQLPERQEQYSLHRLLGALFSAELSVQEKLDIIQNEYDIQTDKVITEGVYTMCNLSQGIRENAERKGRAAGRAEGRAEGQAERETQLIFTMFRKGYTLEQIADVIETSIGTVKDVLAKAGQ